MGAMKHSDFSIRKICIDQSGMRVSDHIFISGNYQFFHIYKIRICIFRQLLRKNIRIIDLHP